MRRRNFTILVAASAAAVVGLCLSLRMASRPDEIAVRFAGVTNNTFAVFVISNCSASRFHFAYLREVHTGGEWPVYGRDWKPVWSAESELPPHAAAGIAVAIPDYGQAWRVAIDYGRPPGWWQRLRNRFAIFLSAHGWNRSASLLYVPSERFAKFTTSPLEVRPSPWVRNPAPPMKP